MSLHSAQILVALVASFVLALQVPAKLFPAIAVLAAGVEALLDFHIITFAVRGVNLGFVLAVILIVCAAIVWAKNDQKLAVTASTAVALVGAIQVFTAVF